MYSGKGAERGIFQAEIRRLLDQPADPLFMTDINVTLTFRIRRPNNHFHACNRDTNIIRVAQLHARVTGGDLDNLAKYSLDCMNEIVYKDDNQIINLWLSKKWCEDATSGGSTTVVVFKNN